MEEIILTPKPIPKLDLAFSHTLPQNNEKCTFLVWIENHIIQNCTSKSAVQCLSKLKHRYVHIGGFHLYLFKLAFINQLYSRIASLFQ